MQREVRSDANGTGQVAQPDRPASADAPPVLDRPADAPTRRCNCPARRCRAMAGNLHSGLMVHRTHPPTWERCKVFRP
jgi:hypothetical protein